MENLTSKPEQPHKLSFFNRLCLIISFWYMSNLLLGVPRNSQSLLSSEAGLFGLGSHMAIPQSMSSKRGNWAAANWVRYKKAKFSCAQSNPKLHQIIISWTWRLLEVILGQRARRNLESVSGNTLQIIPIPLSLILDLSSDSIKVTVRKTCWSI